MGGWLAPASTTCSTKVPRGITHHSTPPKFLVRSSRRSSQLVPTTPQRESKKALSRLLRKEAAIDGIPRKAKSKKQRTQLWPKAVLEALDTAIRENSWESALEVRQLTPKPMFLLFSNFPWHFLAYVNWFDCNTSFPVDRFSGLFGSNDGMSHDANRTLNC